MLGRGGLRVAPERVAGQRFIPGSLLLEHTLLTANILPKPQTRGEDDMRGPEVFWGRPTSSEGLC